LPEINKRITTYEELQPEIDRDLIFFCMNQGLTKKQTSVKLKCAKSTVSMAVKAVENMIDKNESIEKIAEIARVDQKLIEAYIPIYNKNKEILNTKTKCLVCGKNTNRKKSTTCSKECFYSHLARNIPSKEVLIELRKTNTIQKIAEKYGVSQPAVSIWIRRYNMKTRCLNSVQPNVNQ
jgi:predicted transcriptional regulator